MRAVKVFENLRSRKCDIAVEHAKNRAEEVIDAINLIDRLESLEPMSSGDVVKLHPTDCIITTAPISGFGIVKMAVSCEGEILMAKVTPCEPEGEGQGNE